MKDAERHLLTIFSTALEREPAGARAAYLDEACAGAPDLRDRVEALLRAHGQPGRFLEPDAEDEDATLGRSSSSVADATLSYDAPSEGLGAMIGPYRLRQVIGEGGMGTVYMAEQTAPVRRVVALKIIKPGMDTGQVVARFEAERQALAMMDHPSIAKVLDAGATQTGRPFFVMELVKGVPITDYCDTVHLTPKERLELFIPVCAAVQHAHQKGIIHRDLKPSNVLVAMQDGKPVPKVIDFGIAKATNQRLTERSLFTQHGAIVGTLEYMSPEQAEMSAMDVDTRTDVYALGVMLYELLTGSTPLERARLRESGYAEILKRIKEEEPPKPSTRLSESRESLSSVAAQRRTEPARLTKLVRGDLDWIVMKSIEKDRVRRYETANGLARDIQRHLDGDAVEACPPSATYRLSKFARRNKTALFTAALVSLSLVAAVAVLAVSNVRIARETNEKERALHQARANEKVANDQRSLAVKNATEAQTQRGIAVANENAAKQQELLARRRFYAAQISLAQRAIEAGDPARALTLLETLRPKAPGDEALTFEWYYLWRTVHPALLRQSHDVRTLVNGVAFEPNGRTIAAAHHDSDLQLWDVQTGNPSRTCATGGLWCVAWSPDGRSIATGDDLGRVRVWNAALMTQLKAEWKHTSAIRSIAWSPDSRLVAAGSTAPAIGTAYGGVITLNDAATGTERRRLEGHKGGVVALAFSPDGRLLATGAPFDADKGSVILWDWASGTRLWHVPKSRAMNLAFSPDGRLLTFGGNNSQIPLVDVTNGRTANLLAGPTVYSGSAAFRPDGRSILCSWGDGTIRVHDLKTGVSRILGVHLGLNALAVTSDGRRVASGAIDGSLRLWDIAPAPIADRYDAADVTAGAFSPDGRTMLIGNPGPTRLLDTATLRVRGVLPQSNVDEISPDGRLMALRSPDGSRQLWDLKLNRGLGTIPPGDAELRFARDGKTAITFYSGKDQPATIWDVATGQPRETIRYNERALAADFAPDGRSVASGHMFGIVALYRFATRELTSLRVSQGWVDNVMAVAFDASGENLAAGCQMGLVLILDPKSLAIRCRLEGHSGFIMHMMFSPDGRTLATASADRTVRLWDPATGQERLTLRVDKPLARVAFSPDGRTLAAGVPIKVWRGGALSADGLPD